MDYAKRIKELRLKMLLTQIEFAKLLGVSYTKYVDGKKESLNQL